MLIYGQLYWTLGFWLLFHQINDCLAARTYGENLWLKDSEQTVPTTCRNAVNFFDRYMSWKNGSVLKQEILDSFFGKGLRSELVADDRFFYRMLQCFKFSRVTEGIVPEHIFQYCYGYDASNPDSTAYSICIPSICANSSQTLLNNWKTVISDGSDTATITETNCVRSLYEKQWYQKIWPYFPLLLILCLTLMITMATLYDYERSDSTKRLSEELFLAFSVRKNLRTIFVPSISGRRPISCMYGIRTLTMIWIVVGHSHGWISAFIENADDLKADIVNHFHNLWIANYFLTVDVFLVLGGTVNAYGWFSRMETTDVKPSWSSYGYWLRFYRHRLVRLWPGHCFMLICALFIDSINFHEYWPEEDPLVQCSKYWWHNLLLISCFFNSRCMAWTWYISAEFMFYLISPIFLLTLQSSKFRGILLSCATIILSSILRAYIMIAYNLPATQLVFVKPTIFTANFTKQFEQMYIRPQYRIGPYIIGLLLGYYLCKIKNSLPKKPDKFSAFGWVLCIIFGGLGMYGIYPLLQGWNWPIYYVLYGALHRVWFALAVAWLLYACHAGLAEPINRFLSARAFYPFSSLTYMIYLGHFPIVVGSFTTYPFPYHYTNNLILLLKAIGSFAASTVCGLYFSLMVELPCINIEKVFLSKKMPPQRTVQCKSATQSC